MIFQRNRKGKALPPSQMERDSNPLAQRTEHGTTEADGVLPFAQRLTCTIDEACQATGLGRTKLYELIGAGRLATTTTGRRRLVSVQSLRTIFEPKATDDNRQQRNFNH